MNNRDITKLSNPDTVKVIKEQPDTVRITVLRPLDTTDAPVKPPRTRLEFVDQASNATSLLKQTSAQIERAPLPSAERLYLPPGSDPTANGRRDSEASMSEQQSDDVSNNSSKQVSKPAEHVEPDGHRQETQSNTEIQPTDGEGEVVPKNTPPVTSSPLKEVTRLIILLLT